LLRTGTFGGTGVITSGPFTFAAHVRTISDALAAAWTAHDRSRHPEAWMSRHLIEVNARADVDAEAAHEKTA
jgi:hypothetical protein